LDLEEEEEEGRLDRNRKETEGGGERVYTEIEELRNEVTAEDENATSPT